MKCFQTIIINFCCLINVVFAQVVFQSHRFTLSLIFTVTIFPPFSEVHTILVRESHTIFKYKRLIFIVNYLWLFVSSVRPAINACICNCIPTPKPYTLGVTAHLLKNTQAFMFKKYFEPVLNAGYVLRKLQYSTNGKPTHCYAHPAFKKKKTGVDYCGPFKIRPNHLFLASITKEYVTLFTCLVTKTIHLKL